MNCPEVRQLLTEFLAGDLSPATAGVLRGHLEACAPCRQEQQALAQVLRALDSSPVVAAPVDFRKLYLAAADRQRQLTRRWRRLCLTAAAAAGVLLCLLGLRLQVQWDRDQLLVRWSQAPAVETAPDRPEPRPGPVPPKPEAPAPVREEPSYAADLKLLRELVHVLAAEVERLDGTQQQELQQLRTDLARLGALVDQHWSMTKLPSTTLYETESGQRKEEERP